MWLVDNTKETSRMAPNFYAGTSADYMAIAFRRCTTGKFLSGTSAC